MAIAIYSCNDENESTIEMAISPGHLNDTIPNADENPFDSCFVNYDTLMQSRYLSHKFILQKSQENWKGDPIWPQDVCALLQNLDSNETGSYRFLTNKVVFKVLKNAPNTLAFSLTHPATPEAGLNYFLRNVSLSICNDMSIDSLINRIEQDFVLNLYSEDLNKQAKEIKNELLRRLRVNVSLSQ